MFIRHAAGFTLIEALIAMFIFSWIGLASYQILDQIVLAQSVNQAKSESLATTQRVAWQLSRDFRQMVDRPVIDSNGDELPALIHEQDEVLIEFTRRGWSNPLQWARSELQRVAYQIDYHPEYNDADSEYYRDESLYLVRLYWQVLDQTAESEPRRQVLLRDVVDFRTRFWNAADNEWEDTPSLYSRAAGLSDTAVPPAVEVTIVLESDDVMTFIYESS